jgi:hypothetical protein
MDEGGELVIFEPIPISSVSLTIAFVSVGG